MRAKLEKGGKGFFGMLVSSLRVSLENLLVLGLYVISKILNELLEVFHHNPLCKFLSARKPNCTGQKSVGSFVRTASPCPPSWVTSDASSATSSESCPVGGRSWYVFRSPLLGVPVARAPTRESYRVSMGRVSTEYLDIASPLRASLRV